jgi:hypothetical protein
MRFAPPIMAVVLPAIFMFSCAGDEETTTDSEQDQSVEETIQDVEVQELDELDGLVLNNGSKWQVDSTTNAGMTRVINMVTDFDGDDHKKIGKSIKNELSDIISKCTMTGEDHEQYHIVLHAMMKESKRLKKGKSDSMDKMNAYLDAYTSHFEIGNQ